MTSILRPIQRSSEAPLIARQPPLLVAHRIGVRAASERVLIAMIVLVLLFSFGILTLTGNVIFAALPALGAALFLAFWTQPLRRTLLPVVFLQCVVFDAPYATGPLWRQFWEPLTTFMHMRLSMQTGIAALPVTGEELLHVLLIALLCIRVLRGQRIDAVDRGQTANVLFVFLAVSVFAVACLTIWGLSTGGNLKATVFQLRSVIWLPLLTVLLSFALRDSQDFRLLGITITLAAMVKSAVGMYFLASDGWGEAITPAYMTSHDDSVLYVCVIVIWIAAYLHEGSWSRLVTALVVVLWMLAAIYVNNRRLAYVNLAGALLVFYPLLSGRTKRKIKLGLILAFPLFLVYLFLARTHSGGIFAPGATLMGIAKTADPSTQWRVLENQNLIYTIRENRFLGSGFGKEWLEIITLPDISFSFKEYKLIAHNSVLWLLGVSGVVGFTLIWMPIVVGVFLATRSYHFATTNRERTAALAVVVIAVCYVSQAWGDIGLLSSLTTLLMALGLALAGKLARETGAWPSDARII